jgi:hypothetical protein
MTSGSNGPVTRGIGIGPTRAVLREGVKRLTESPIFGLRGDFYHLDFQRVTSSERQNLHWVAGFWSAFHLIALKLTPDPITPWLFYAVVYGESGFPTDIDYIRALDPTSAAILEPWFAFHEGHILPDGVDGEVQQILMVYLEIHEVFFKIASCHFQIAC